MISSSQSNGLFTWSWRADLWAQEGMPVGLGHALSMQAIHGGNAKHDTIDAQNIAVLLRGGLLPQASVDPADMRATRALLRRRMHGRRQRAARLPPVQNTHSQSNLPELGRTLVYPINRDGVAERVADPAGHKSLAVDLALLGHDDARLGDVERSILKAAQPPDAHTLYRRRTVPGIGDMLRLVLRDEMHDIPRCPRVQDVAADGRLVTCAKESAGKPGASRALDGRRRGPRLWQYYAPASWNA